MESSTRLNELLDISLQQYTEMLELLQLLQEKLEFTSMKAATLLLSRYQLLEREARLNDDLLVELLKEQDGEALETGGSIRLDMLKKLQVDVQNEIGGTIVKAKNIKMLLTAEKNSVAQGRTAMQGYRSPLAGNGKILNGTW